MVILDTASIGKTVQLNARDYNANTGDSTYSAQPLVQAPPFARAIVRGRILGLAGAYAMLGTDLTAWNAQPPPGAYPSGVEVVPVDQHFHFVLNGGQTLYGLGSVSPQVPWGNAGAVVIATFNVEYVELDLKLPPANSPEGSGVEPAGVTGPGPGWRRS